LEEFEKLVDNKWSIVINVKTVDIFNLPNSVGLQAKKAMFVQVALSKYEVYLAMNLREEFSEEFRRWN
jgi:hypothetical protein